MHTNNTFKFDTEAEAVAFANSRKAMKTPNEDLYVTGPTFMDEDVIFKNMLLTSKGQRYWQVDVECYY